MKTIRTREEPGLHYSFSLHVTDWWLVPMLLWLNDWIRTFFTLHLDQTSCSLNMWTLLTRVRLHVYWSCYINTQLGLWMNCYNWCSLKKVKWSPDDLLLRADGPTQDKTTKCVPGICRGEQVEHLTSRRTLCRRRKKVSAEKQIKTHWTQHVSLQTGGGFESPFRAVPESQSTSHLSVCDPRP